MSFISNNNLMTIPENINLDLRDNFEANTININWISSLGSANDILQFDGNAVGASYLVLSKDPLANNTVSTITSTISIPVPHEISIGLAMSQRTWGQELAVEVISDEAATSAMTDIAISTISQSTTTLTVNTTAAHGLLPGERFGIYGSPDSRFNYPSLVIASVPSTTQFTATAGPQGTITSVTAGPVSGGFVFFRPALNYAVEGSSIIFENSTATNASIYTKTLASNDVLPTGTIIGAHGITVGSTASTQAINSAYTYAFYPTSEYRFNLMQDRLQWSDVGVDSVAAPNNRSLRTQIIPSHYKKYKLRFRLTNNKSYPVPVAQIVSASKSGTTTATITTDIPHGLTTTDFVLIYGINNQTDFPNQSTAVAVASTPTTTTFTVVITATTPTTTSYGGTVLKAQGNDNTLGLSGQVVGTATLTSGILTLTSSGAATWAGFVIGDYINIVGVRNTTTGATLGVDGVYRVQNLATSTIILQPIGNTVVPADFAVTNAGGAVIKRTDLRLHFVRFFDYARQRVEVMARPNGDLSAAIPTQTVIQSGTVTTLTTLTTLSNQTQIGGYNANDQMYNLTRQAAASARRNITVS
jgi:hypothetical protein